MIFLNSKKSFGMRLVLKKNTILKMDQRGLVNLSERL